MPYSVRHIRKRMRETRNEEHTKRCLKDTCLRICTHGWGRLAVQRERVVALIQKMDEMKQRRDAMFVELGETYMIQMLHDKDLRRATRDLRRCVQKRTRWELKALAAAAGDRVFAYGNQWLVSVFAEGLLSPRQMRGLRGTCVAMWRTIDRVRAAQNRQENRQET